MAKTSDNKSANKIVASNRRASSQYEILETLEAASF